MRFVYSSMVFRLFLFATLGLLVSPDTAAQTLDPKTDYLRESIYFLGGSYYIDQYQWLQ